MKRNELLEQYLDKYFPDLEICSPLFYNASVGIRFEIGNPDPTVSDEKYAEQVLYRSTTLFKETHHTYDEIFILIYHHLHRRFMKPHKRKMKVFTHSIKDKAVLKRISCKKVYMFDEEDDGWETYHYVLKCKASDIKYFKFLFADYDVYFINVTKNTIFHFYDDRGLDIVANSREVLQELYVKYNDWILDYDRKQIDKVFSS